MFNKVFLLFHGKLTEVAMECGAIKLDSCMCKCFSCLYVVAKAVCMYADMFISYYILQY